MTTSTSALAISARAVRKSFGDQVALDGIDLTVTEGTIFALPGPNGAGKTTIVRILSTLIPADAGTIRGNYPAGQWITRERERLTRSLERAAGQNTRTPGRSR